LTISAAPLANLLPVLGFEVINASWILPAYAYEDLPSSRTMGAKRALQGGIQSQEFFTPLIMIEVDCCEAVA
jgi:hypothetical protein